jgi:DNA-binding PadR family transcriptional regulator
VNEIEKRVLRSFEYWGQETLDLHQLFEAGGNDPEQRTAVFYAVEKLVEDGLLQEEGNDFYSLTEKGRETAKSA